MADDAQDRGLVALLVEGVARGLAVDGQPFVGAGMLGVPALQGPIQGHGVHAGEHLADDGATGDRIAKPRTREARFG